MRLFLLISIFCIHSFAFALSLTPPTGWECINDPEQLPQKVKLIYVGAAKGQFTPSINIAYETTNLQASEYVAQAKSYHEGIGNTKCVLLGNLETAAGKALLLQIDRLTTWGNVRFVQGILVNNGEAYVITGTCLQEDFGGLSKEFFKSMQSFSINTISEK